MCRPAWSRSASVPAWAPRPSSSGYEPGAAITPTPDSEAPRPDPRPPSPAPCDGGVHGRGRRRLGNGAGLNQFGFNPPPLPPGAASALRHWHASEDELVFVLEGEVVLV